MADESKDRAKLAGAAPHAEATGVAPQSEAAAGATPGAGCRPDAPDATASAANPMLSRRAALRLAGIAAGGVVAAGVAAHHNASVPDAGAKGKLMYEYLTNRAKFRSTAFMVGNRLADALPVFGSSELSFLPSDCMQVPHAVFGWHDYGLDLWTIGEGYNQSLWHAIAIAAYDDALSREPAPTDSLPQGVFDARGSRKMVLIISPQWFYEGGIIKNATQTQFGYGLWQQACANPRVDPARIDYLAGRLRDQGIEARKVSAARHITLFDALNDVAFGFDEDYQQRRALIHVRDELGDTLPFAKVDLTAEDGVPDWDALLAQAAKEAEARTTSNDFGMLDAIWNSRIKGDFDSGRLKDIQKGRSLTKAPTEDADFDCCLGIANDCGIDLLCVLQPYAGDWADYEGLSRDTREARYELIRPAVEEHGFRLADFSDQEYTRHFIIDGTHLGWLGWPAVERAIYEFVMGA